MSIKEQNTIKEKYTHLRNTLTRSCDIFYFMKANPSIANIKTLKSDHDKKRLKLTTKAGNDFFEGKNNSQIESEIKNVKKLTT